MSNLNIANCIFYEKINFVKLNYILNNKDQYKDQIENQEKEMRRNKHNNSTISVWTQLKKIKKNCILVPYTEYAYIPVLYNKGKNSNNTGRWYAIESIGIAPMCTSIRHTICDDIWIDIDQVNSHIKIMQCFMVKYGFTSPLLNECCNNRENFLKIIMKEENCSRNQAKTSVISCVNGGKFKTKTLNLLIDELKPCINHVIELEENKEIYNYTRKEYVNNLSNLNGKVISRILQEIENTLLECYVEFSFRKNLIPKYLRGYQVSLIFDGFQLIKNDLINEKFLEEMRLNCLKKTGYDIELKIKLFDNKLDLPNNYCNEEYNNLKEDNDIKILQKKENQDKLNEHGYDIIKKEFEKNVCKNNADGSFIRQDNNDTYFIKKETLNIIYSNLFCYVKTEEKIEEKWFINKWLSDPDMKCVRKITFDPSKKCANDIYNRFKGFRAESLDPVNDDEVDELIEPIIRHYKEVLYREHWEYAVELDRQIIKNPTEKSGIIVVLKGEQGIGKDITMDLLLRHQIIGTDYASQCGGITPLFERFETLTPNKLLCICDEVSIVEVYKDRTLNEKIKNLVTKETNDLEIKNVTKITIPNYINIRCTTNNENAGNIPPDDRRYCVFLCSSVHKNNAKYMETLIDACKNDRVARAYYQYLLRDECKYKNTHEFQKNRPLTEYYKELVIANLQPFDRFLSYLCIYGTYYSNIPDDFEKPIQLKYTAYEVYEKYKDWLQCRKWSNDITCTAFGRKLSLISYDDNQSIIKIKGCKTTYTFNLLTLENYLKSKTRFDPDIY